MWQGQDLRKPIACLTGPSMMKSEQRNAERMGKSSRACVMCSVISTQYKLVQSRLTHTNSMFSHFNNSHAVHPLTL